MRHASNRYAASTRRFSESEEAGPAAEKKWVWNPADPPPDPKAAYPCGSGRRYKKCCMPR